MVLAITWGGGTAQERACPACLAPGVKRPLLAVDRPSPGVPLELLACHGCGTLFFPALLDAGAGPATPPAAPSEETPPSVALDFYLEQGAGLRTMMEMLGAVEPHRVRRFLEVGCGFGLSLDIARTLFGWEVRGVDPGPLARWGATRLGLPIESAVLAPEPAPGEQPHELILATEVIEHIADPLPFLRSVRTRLGPDGTLLLTTPNAALVRPGAPNAALLPALSVGHHPVLYSRTGLERLLQRAGFTSVQVTEGAVTLRAAASLGNGQADPERPLGGEAYLTYLTQRARTLPAANPLGLGLRQRLLKELMMAGRFRIARQVAQDIAGAVASRWGLDLANPDEVVAALPPSGDMDAFHRTAPFCLAGLLLQEGLLAWKLDRQTERARRLCDAAALAADRTRAALMPVGVDDLEIWRTRWEGSVYAAQLLAMTAPEEAVRRLWRSAAQPSGGAHGHEAMPEDLRLEMIFRVFATLAESGHHGAARRIAGLVADSLPGTSERTARALALARAWRAEQAPAPNDQESA